MVHMLKICLFHKPVPLFWQVLLWLVGGLGTLGICYVKPSGAAQAVMLLSGLVLLAIWFRYTRLAVWTSALNDRSLFLKVVAVIGGVLLVSALVLMAPSN
ncbi:hypothetical protein V0M98_34795 (plasmid) [Pseudomonas silesiensis]|uniref:hypothetical protein n=1 Tax=Pseudomonas silesiensis TaxID=1853130 RepID=UPI0030D24B33